MIVHLTDTKAVLMGGAAIAGGAISQAFGGWDSAMMTLLIFMAIDYVSGLIVAGVFHSSDKSETGTLNSAACWQGLLKKRDDAGDCARGCAAGYRAGHSICP